MPSRNHGPSVKDDAEYEALRRAGYSEEKSARIANASAAQGRSRVGARGGRAGSYDEMTRRQLDDRARRLGIPGRSRMSKVQLIDALRNH
ncbi:MAG: Rho termination factor N-terminal domain-containing protein [Acidimicrobiales bacterium]